MRSSVYFAFVSGLLTCVPGFAADKPQRLGLCASCHGADGHSSAPQIPNLAGQNLPYLRGAIAQYQSGKRDFPAMRTALGMLNAAEVDAILTWYAQQNPRPAAP